MINKKHVYGKNITPHGSAKTFFKKSFETKPRTIIKTNVKIFIIVCSLFSKQLVASIGITNVASAQPGGRLFGDCVNEYIKARWFAYKYNLDFYFQPFVGSDRLMASRHEIVLSQKISSSFSRHIAVNYESDIQRNMEPGTLFFIQPYARGIDYHTEDFLNYLFFNNENDFIKKMRNFVQFKEQLKPIPMPERMIKVAVHIRRPLQGLEGNLYSLQEYDSSIYEINDIMFYLNKENFHNISIDKLPNPLNCQSPQPAQVISYGVYGENAGSAKLAPTQFYIDAIKKLSDFFHDAPLYVYFFSNDLSPQKLYKEIEKNVNKNNITYGYSNFNLDSRSNPQAIDDCYYMSQFDCLIKSISTFSTIAQFLGNHAITITPGAYFWDQKKLVINKRLWIIRDDELINANSINQKA